jgi:hypothetical protein
MHILSNWVLLKLSGRHERSWHDLSLSYCKDATNLVSCLRSRDRPGSIAERNGNCSFTLSGAPCPDRLGLSARAGVSAELEIEGGLTFWLLPDNLSH